MSPTDPVRIDRVAAAGYSCKLPRSARTISEANGAAGSNAGFPRAGLGTGSDFPAFEETVQACPVISRQAPGSPLRARAEPGRSLASAFRAADADGRAVNPAVAFVRAAGSTCAYAVQRRTVFGTDPSRSLPRVPQSVAVRNGAPGLCWCVICEGLA